MDDATAARLRHIAGWKTVVTGAVTALSAGYRLNLRAMDVESAELLGAKNYVIKSDAILAGIVNPSQTVRERSRREELLRPFTEPQNAFDLTVRPTGGKDVFYDGDEMLISLKARRIATLWSIRWMWKAGYRCFSPTPTIRTISSRPGWNGRCRNIPVSTFTPPPPLRGGADTGLRLRKAYRHIA